MHQFKFDLLKAFAKLILANQNYRNLPGWKCVIKIFFGEKYNNYLTSPKTKILFTRNLDGAWLYSIYIISDE